MNFREGNEITTEINEFLYFRWNPENMIFRQGNESTTEIHEFPYFRRDDETWISVKEMKALQKFMNFRISVQILKTWISVKQMKAKLNKSPPFRWTVDNIYRSETEDKEKVSHCLKKVTVAIVANSRMRFL